MSQAKPTGICSTCGVLFERKRPRQRKCDLCISENVFVCQICREPYERVDAKLACDPCLDELAARPKHQRWPWSRHLNLLGNSMNRGKVTAVSEVPVAIPEDAPCAVRTPLAAPANHDEFMSAQIERHGHVTQSEPGPNVQLELWEALGVTQREFLDWFFRAPAHYVAEKFGIKTESVQRLRSYVLDIPREEVERAKIALNITPDDWKTWKITNGLIDARIRDALTEMRIEPERAA